MEPNLPTTDNLAEDFEHQLDLKPPLISTNSAPPVLQSDYVIQEEFKFGSCPANESDFLGTPAAEKGAFEYPETPSAGSSRRPSVIHPSLRRGSSVSSTTSTATVTSNATRRPSLAPAYTAPIAGPSDYDMFRRRGSLAHFPTKPVHAPIPPSLLARRGSLPAADAMFGIPINERRGHSRSSLSSTSPIVTANAPPPKHMDVPHSPPSRHTAFRLRMPPSAFARRGSLPTSPRLPESVAEQGEHQEYKPSRNRQTSCSSSTRGSALSRSSFSSEDDIQDGDESTDDTSAVDTPSSVSDTEARELFSDPWAADRQAMAKPAIQEEEDAHERAVTM
jgi:hypothetical protein